MRGGDHALSKPRKKELLSVQERMGALRAKHLADESPPHRDSANGLSYANGGLYLAHWLPALRGLKKSAIALARDVWPEYANSLLSRIESGQKRSVSSLKAKPLLAVPSKALAKKITEREARERWLIQIFARLQESPSLSPDGKELARFFERLRLIDWDDGSEWGQVYFSLGAGKGGAKGKPCLNQGSAQAKSEAKRLNRALKKAQKREELTALRV